jgi:hypothetical protein
VTRSPDQLARVLTEALDYAFVKVGTAELAQGLNQPLIETTGQREDALAALAELQAQAEAGRRLALWVGGLVPVPAILAAAAPSPADTKEELT